MTDEELRSAQRSQTAAKHEPRSEAKQTSEAKQLRFAAPLPLLALFAVVSLIAAFAYGISAWQVYGFAAKVWGVPEPLRYASAVIADLLSLAGLFATYLLRTAKKSVRAYAWFVFLAMTGLSIAAAESFAHWRSLDEVAQEAATQHGGTASQIASGAVVVSLALAVHLLIVVRRHVTLGDEIAPAVASSKSIPPPAAVKAPNEAPKTERPMVRPEVAPTPSPVSSGRKPQARTSRPVGPAPTIPASRIEAADRVIDGTPAKDVAAELGVSKRAVEGWAAARRKQLAEPMPTLSLIKSGVAEQPDPEPVNGYAFKPGAATEAQVN